MTIRAKICGLNDPAAVRARREPLDGMAFEIDPVRYGC